MVQARSWVEVISLCLVASAGVWAWVRRSYAPTHLPMNVYRAEDGHLKVGGAEEVHVRVINDIDVPVPNISGVGELPGDEDVAWAWGNHPSVQRPRGLGGPPNRTL